MKTRKQRQEEAAVRQAEYSALSTSQKITRAMGRRGNSAKELNRLNIRRNEEQACQN